MKRKGVSPLVAAVLLIAFTMAVATMFAQLAPQFIQEDPDNSDQNKNISSCDSIGLELVNSSVNSATVQLTSDNTLGDRNVSVTWHYADADQVQVSNGTISQSQESLTYNLDEFNTSLGEELESVEATATGC